MTTRPCEFCADWDEKYLEEYLTPDTVCGYCNGSKVLGIRDCFCCAYEPSECGCDADWSDYVYWGGGLMTDYNEPYWCDEHGPLVKCYEWCPMCAEWGEYEVKEKESKIPDLTCEIAQRVEANAGALAAIGVKEWMRQRKKKPNMTELEQKEAVRKLEEDKLNDKGT